MWDVIFCTFVVYTLYLLFGAVLFMFLENTSDFVPVDIKDDTFESKHDYVYFSEYLQFSRLCICKFCIISLFIQRERLVNFKGFKSEVIPDTTCLICDKQRVGAPLTTLCPLDSITADFMTKFFILIYGKS